MSKHPGHLHAQQSYGPGGLDGLAGDIAHDIADLITDLLKLLGSCGCHPPGCHPPCFCPGTMILTTEGEVPVETLEVGQSVVTASGRSRPIRWLGRRQFDIARHAAPAFVRPVRVKAGAFGPELPRRDLLISPGHSVFVEDALIPVRFLLNGTTVSQEQDAATVTYHHVELDEHDVLVAEGLPSESYLDTGNRGDFEHAGQPVELHPTFEPKDWADTCAPLIKSGVTVEAVKRGLLARATGLGHRITEENDLHILADGRRVEPVRDGRFYRFTLPGEASVLRLVSRRWVPAHLSPESQDDRELGVCVARIEIDGAEVALGMLTAGWHGFDVSGGTSYRWTNGSAALPSHARRVVVELCGSARYWASEASRADLLQRAA